MISDILNNIKNIFSYRIFIAICNIFAVQYCRKKVSIMASVNVRIDDDIKRDAEEILKRIGVTPSAAINMFYIQIIRTASIPFELKVDISNQETLEALEELKEFEKDPSKGKRYHSVKELMKDLRKEDEEG